jgi:hypothetical protein
MNESLELTPTPLLPAVESKLLYNARQSSLDYSLIIIIFVIFLEKS